MKLLARAFAAIWTAWMCADLIAAHQVGAHLLAVPLGAAVLAVLPWPRAIRVGTQVSGVFVLTMFVIATGATFGVLFLPSAFAARAAATPSLDFSPVLEFGRKYVVQGVKDR